MGLTLLGLAGLAASLRHGLWTAKSARPENAAWPRVGAATALAPVLLNSIDMRLLLIPAGQFAMGLSEAEAQERLSGVPQTQDRAWYIEKVKSQLPRHPVRITRPFYLGEYLVTQSEYQR